MASKFQRIKTTLRKRSINDLVRLVRIHITDPRRISHGNIKFPIEVIVVIYIIAKICGAISFRAVEDFAKSHIIFFNEFFNLKKDVPSAERYRLVMMSISSEEMVALYRDFFSLNYDILSKKLHIAIDGKNVNGSKRKNENAKNIVSAMNSDFNALINQYVVDEKDSEIYAMLDLIIYMHKIGYKNLVITGDAIYTQINISDAIINFGWNYCFSLKGNQEKLLNVAKKIYEIVKNDFFSQDNNKLHGRNVNRKFFHVNNVNDFCKRNNINYDGKWKEIPSIGIVESKYIKNDKESIEIRYYITSLTNKEEFVKYVTAHWYIENNVHWQLDTTYYEDLSRIYDKNLIMNNNICLKFGLRICNLGLSYFNKANMTFPRIKNLMLMDPHNIERFIS